MKEFQKELLLFILLFVVTLTGVLFAMKGESGSGLWSIDNSSCVGCGGCATNCVRPESAVSAVMDESVCPKRFDCPAFFRKGALFEDSPENELCPSGAIVRIQESDSTYRYSVDPSKCIGCGKCTRVCQNKCDGALTLVIDTDECVDCNECQIAVTCPKDAVIRGGVQ